MFGVKYHNISKISQYI